MITELQSLNFNIITNKGVNNKCGLKCLPYFLREKHFLKCSILEKFPQILLWMEFVMYPM